MPSLKEIYQADQQATLLSKLHRKAKLNEAKVILEHNAIRILVEALDDNDVKAITGQLDKLISLVQPVAQQVPSLAAAVKAAQSDLQKQMSGGITSKIGQSALAKTMALVGALKQGFGQVPNLAKLVKPVDGQPVDKAMPLNDILDPSSKQNALKMFKNAFTPPGIFNAIKSMFGGGLPYVKNTSVLAQELLNLPYNELEKFGSAAQTIQLPISSQEANQLAQDVKSGDQGQPQQGSQQAPQGGEQAMSNANNATPADAGNGQKMQQQGMQQQQSKTPAAGGLAPIGSKDLASASEEIASRVAKASGGRFNDQQIQLVKRAVAEVLKGNFPKHFA